MTVMSLLVLCALGVLAWLLAGGWPYVRDTYVADDGPLGLGAGITARCPACQAGAGSGPVAEERPLAALIPAQRRRTVDAVDLVPGLLPSSVGRDASLRVECPRCGATYAVLGGNRPRIVPTQRTPVD